MVMSSEQPSTVLSSEETTSSEVAPENVYSDRSFSYQSEIRKREAEEWIRSSTPREFSQNIMNVFDKYKEVFFV